MKNNWYTFPVGAATTLAFFFFFYLTGEWGKSWIVFLINPIAYWIIHNSKKENITREKDELEVYQK
ncbi:hypothetical protein [Lactococcus garvieae]